ncbi:hypothetical protein [Thiocapsa imhoffii]|uniref:hypothetical protein n=1 Tax=Thiocapsa imhoffii TaxID=382777 RepID=UPI0019065969|nr:hypothetical protein [Thiocapsa imhoffii]
MPDVNSTRTRREDGAPSNWDRYLDLLIRRQVPAKFRQWYVRRVEDFLKDLKPAALPGLTADQVTITSEACRPLRSRRMADADDCRSSALIFG